MVAPNNNGARAPNCDDPMPAQAGQWKSGVVAAVEALLQHATPAEIAEVRGLLVSGRAENGNQQSEAAVPDRCEESYPKRRRGRPVEGTACFWPAALRKRWGISTTTLWRWERSAAIPARDFHINGKAVAWRRQTILHFECASPVTKGKRR